MHRGILVALLAVPSVARSQAARLEQADGEPRIVATATRATRVAPDRATFYVMVEGTGESPAEAARRAGQRVQAVTDALRQHGSGVEFASAAPYGVAPAPNIAGYPGGSAQTSYIARFGIRVQVQRLDQLTPVVAAALEAGASSGSPPFFEASSADSTRRVRSSEALAAARQDAEAMAAALGGRLGALLEVSTATPTQGGIPSFVSFSTRYELSGQAQPPDVLVSTTVTIRYRFVPR